MKQIKVVSPTRVDLAGGTLDLWPLYNFIGGATTVNVAIDIYTEAVIEETGTSEIELVSADLKMSKKYKNLSEALSDESPEMRLLQRQLSYWRPQKGFKLSTRSQSPVGGGLGGSSSLTISLLRAFSQFCQKPFSDTHALVHVAHNLEADILNTPTGTQDYYPAASGGVNIITYNADGIEQQVLRSNTEELEKHFMLAYTGKAHHSGLNNFEVMQRAVQKDAKTISALKNLREVSEQTAQVAKSGNWSKLPELFRREFASRVQLAEAFSSPEIEKLSEVSLRAGAQAVKICGAGGGGCVLLWVSPAQRAEVTQACQKAGFQILGAKPVAPLQ